MSSANPITEFLSAVERAAARQVDTAPVALATADQHGRPSVRMVLLRGADGNTATGVAERLRSVVEHLAVTASFGVATRVATDTGPYTLVERADRALYAAKRAGRNRVHFDEVWEKDATA